MTPCTFCRSHLPRLGRAVNGELQRRLYILLTADGLIRSMQKKATGTLSFGAAFPRIGEPFMCVLDR
jgi:hypothetical protein